MAGKPEDSWEPAARHYRDIEKQQMDPIETFVDTIKGIVLGEKEPVQNDFALDA